MIKFLSAPFRALFARLAPAANPMEEPLLAGYHRPLPRWIPLALIVGLLVFSVIYGFFFSAWAPSRMMPFTIPIALSAALIVWMLPPGDHGLEKYMEPLLVAFFAALVLWPNYLALALPSLPWVTMLRIFGAPMVLIFLATLSTSKRFRQHLGEIVNSDHVMWKMMVALVVLQMISIPLSTSIGDTLNKYIVAQINFTAIFFISCYVFTRRNFAELWVRMLLVMLFVVGLFAVWEWSIQHLPWAGHIPSYLRNDDPVVARILAPHARAASGIYRVLSTSTTPLGLAEILGLSIPFAVHLALERYSLITRVAAAAYIPFAVWVIILTDSRLGLVACLATLAFYFLIWSLMRWRLIRQSLFGPALVLAYPVLFVLLVAATFTVAPLRSQVVGDGSQNASNQARIVQWEMAIPKIMRNPIGHGLGKGGETLGYTNLAGGRTIDSYYISVLLEIGVLGFIVYYGLMLRAVFSGTRTLLQREHEREIRLILAFVVSILNFVIVKSVLSQDGNHPLVFMMLGAVVALMYRAGKAGPRATVPA